MRRLLLFLLSACASSWASRAGAVDVRVGSDRACDTSSLQAAIDSANAALVTNILIARNATYEATSLRIVGKDVRLVGGFADCAQSEPDDVRTVISGAGGAMDSVIKVRGKTTSVAFLNLDIVGGDALQAGAGNHGGGVEIDDGPHALIYFENVLIRGNTALEGGGLWIKNEHSSKASDVFVWLNDNTRISGNRATGSGGGIWCSNAKVDLTGRVDLQRVPALGSSIADNHAGKSGGGIRAENCVVNIATADLYEFSISRNTADGPGGGISVSGERAVVNLYTQNPSAPTMIGNNLANGVGGGIDIGSSATVKAWDVLILQNTSRSGGAAVSVYDNDNAPHASFTMQAALDGAPSAKGSPEGVAVNCVPLAGCNRIQSNRAAREDDVPRVGGAIRASGATYGSDIYSDGTSWALVTLKGTTVDSNFGENLLEEIGQADVLFNGVVLFNNWVRRELLHAPDDIQALNVRWSTIAGNQIGGDATFRSSMDGSASSWAGTHFKNSIHWQPGTRVYSVVSGTVNSHNTEFLLSNDLTGIPEPSHSVVVDPGFIGGGNYHLAQGSHALDYAPADASACTADHLPRVQDLSIDDKYGPQDLGAFERQPDF
jgi:predicted outer membrane repeat protein